MRKKFYLNYLVFLCPIFSAAAGSSSVLLSELPAVAFKKIAYGKNRLLAEDPVELVKAFEWSFQDNRGVLLLAIRGSAGGECRIMSEYQQKIKLIASSKSWHACRWGTAKPTSIRNGNETILKFETFEDVYGDGISMEKSYQKVVFNPDAKKFCRYNENMTPEDEIALAKPKSYCYSY